MIYGDRASQLIRKLRGKPIYDADQAASTTIIHNHVISPALAVAIVGATLAVCGGSLGLAMWTGALRHSSAEELRLMARIAALGIDVASLSDADLTARLALPADRLRSVVALLSMPDTADPAVVSWLDKVPAATLTLPSLANAVAAFASYAAALPPSERPVFLGGLREDAILSRRAHEILQALREVSPQEDGNIHNLLVHLLELDPSERIALETSGFAPMPKDPRLHVLYVRVAKAPPESVAALTAYLDTNTAHRRATLTCSTALLKDPRASRVLGDLLRGDGLLAEYIDQLDPGCSVDTPTACVRSPQ